MLSSLSICYQFTILFILISMTYLTLEIGPVESANGVKESAKKATKLMPCVDKHVVLPWRRSLTYAGLILICIGGPLSMVLMISYANWENRRLILHDQNDAYAIAMFYGRPSDARETEESHDDQQRTTKLSSLTNDPHQCKSETTPKTDRVYEITDQKTELSLEKVLKKEKKDYNHIRWNELMKLKWLWKQDSGRDAENNRNKKNKERMTATSTESNEIEKSGTPQFTLVDRQIKPSDSNRVIPEEAASITQSSRRGGVTESKKGKKVATKLPAAAETESKRGKKAVVELPRKLKAIATETEGEGGKKAGGGNTGASKPAALTKPEILPSKPVFTAPPTPVQIKEES